MKHEILNLSMEKKIIGLNMKIASIVSARPQFIKCAPIPKKIPNFHEILIHMEQHFAMEMFQIFFNDFIIPYPDYILEVTCFLMDGHLFNKEIEIQEAESKVVAIIRNLKQYDSLGVIDWHVRTSYPNKNTELFQLS